MKSGPSPFGRFLPASLGILALLAVMTQLQPLLLHALGAVDGTFGLRPATHDCVGVIMDGKWVAKNLPQGEWQGTFGLFKMRYFNRATMPDWEYCLGQDIWFGE